MGLRSKSMRKSKGNQYDVEITKEDEKNMKFTANENQLLNAVNEAQPFQDSNDRANRQSMGVFLATRQNNVDVFGLPIRQPDVSNPSRSRDERPLDTIRSFEFSITHEDYYKERLESRKLGFHPRPEFPLYKANPYNNGNGGGSSSRPAQTFEQPVYAAQPKPAVPQKKKKGLFGRKK